MGFQKVYLDYDAPDVFPPSDREEKWGFENVNVSANSPEENESVFDRHETQKQQFIDTFLHRDYLKDSAKSNNNDVKPEIFLRFHLHRDVIKKLLEQDTENCYGISITLAAKYYQFRDSPTPTLGTTIITCGVGKNMKDLPQDGVGSGIYYEAVPSPCPPARPCPSQRKELIHKDEKPEYKQIE